MLGVGRDLCGSFSPIPLLKQGHLQQAAQDLVQAGLEYLQGRRLHNLPGQRVPVLHHPQSEEVLPHVQVELAMLQFVPFDPCPVAGHHWKESGEAAWEPEILLSGHWVGCIAKKHQCRDQPGAAAVLEFWLAHPVHSHTLTFVMACRKPAAADGTNPGGHQLL